MRLTGLVQPSIPGGATLELRPFLRSSRTEFLQHFLLGQPVEKNGQESGGLMTSLAWGNVLDWSVITGVDLELGYSTLKEFQENPTTGGTPPANAIRPAGLHYDYDVHSNGGVDVPAGRASRPLALADRRRASRGMGDLRVRQPDAGRQHGRPGRALHAVGCLYSRPADRTDHFYDWTPKLTLSFEITAELVAYANASQGFRPPEMTELYRLQRTQQVADLEPEELDSLELGLKGSWPQFDFALALYDMDRSGVILRESNGYYVANGRTTHRGVEYDLRWRPLASLELSAAGTYARHRYDFSRQVDGGETIKAGNDMDTAPREIGRYGVDWRPRQALEFEAEWMTVGDYWLDAANLIATPATASSTCADSGMSYRAGRPRCA